MQETAVIDGTAEIVLTHWSEFFELTKTFFTVAPAFVYRGQANYSWPLRSTLDRLVERFPKLKNLCGTNPEFFDEARPLSESEHLNAFRRAIRGMRGSNPAALNDDECWALGQHHGLATPLLDWTRSPFVALFFAFEEETININGSLVKPDFRGVFALSTHTIPEEEMSIVSPESDSNYRLISQSAIFIKLPPQKDVEILVTKHFHGETRDSTFRKIKIPNEDRDGCLVALNKMNINHMTLFPDIDGAARHVNSLWQPGHTDSIAYV